MPRAKPPLRDRFRTWLVDSEFAPGTTIPGEIDLARRFGVSRAAIREVIMHFAHLGVLERVRNRGTTVCAVAPERLAGDLSLCFGLAGFSPGDLTEARRLVEVGVAGLAARRLTPSGAARLRALIEAMATETNLEHADALDRDFHLALVETCGNPCLSLFAGVIQTLFRRQHRQRYHTRAAIAKSVADHRVLLDLLERGDASAAQARIAAHIVSV